MGKQVVIVGAGPGGLAASMLLAKAGLDVTILERLPHVGGRTSAIEADGFRFDLGPTFFLYPRVLERIFAAVGRDLRSEVEMVKLDPQYRIIFGERGELQATPDVGRLEAEVAKLCPADAKNIRRFLDDNRHKLDEFRYALEKPFNGWSDLFDRRLIKMLPMLRPWLSVEGELSRYFSDERLRLAFSFQSKYLGMSPFNCPSLFSILSFLEYEYGVWHPMGGCSAVSERMAEIAIEMGVEIRLSEEVTGIDFAGTRAVGVRTACGRYELDSLVINADFSRAMSRMVPDNLRRNWTDHKIAGKRFSCSTFMLYLGIEGTFDDLPHHTIYTSNDYLQNLDDIERTHRLSADPSVYVQNACVTDPGLAPRGCSTLYILAPVTHQHQNVDWNVEARRFRDVVLRQLPRMGFHGVEHRIRFEKMITPADWDNNYQIHLGATFNLAHNLRQMLHLRPRNRFEDLEGVYLVGGGTHPGSGLPVIYESARITSRLMLNDWHMNADWIDSAEQLKSLGVG